MADGFYYPIYPHSTNGGGPSPRVYSVQQQVVDAAASMNRILLDNERTAQAYRDLGIWYPEEAAMLFQGTGALVSAWA